MEKHQWVCSKTSNNAALKQLMDLTLDRKIEYFYLSMITNGLFFVVMTRHLLFFHYGSCAYSHCGSNSKKTRFRPTVYVCTRFFLRSAFKSSQKEQHDKETFHKSKIVAFIF